MTDRIAETLVALCLAVACVVGATAALIDQGGAGVAVGPSSAAEVQVPELRP